MTDKTEAPELNDLWEEFEIASKPTGSFDGHETYDIDAMCEAAYEIKCFADRTNAEGESLRDKIANAVGDLPDGSPYILYADDIAQQLIRAMTKVDVFAEVRKEAHAAGRAEALGELRNTLVQRSNIYADNEQTEKAQGFVEAVEELDALNSGEI